jgi:SAM-dependent methyltransferase
MVRHFKLPVDIFKNKKVLDIGCGLNKLKGAIGLDHVKLDGVDVVADLNKQLPFESNQFDAVFANQVLEHVDNIIGLVYEVHRILKLNGIFLAHAPYFRSSWAHIDPTHVRSFTINSMDYFVKGTYCYENYRFRDEAFVNIEVYMDNDYDSTLFRRYFSSKALKNPFKFENTLWSCIYPFEQVSFLLTK